MENKEDMLPACCWVCEHCLNYSLIFGQYLNDVCALNNRCVEITDDEKPYAFRMSWCPLEKESEEQKCRAIGYRVVKNEKFGHLWYLEKFTEHGWMFVRNFMASNSWEAGRYLEEYKKSLEKARKNEA